MKHFVLLFLVAGIFTGLALSTPAQDEAAKPAPAVNAQKYVTTLIKFMSSPDPRLRFSVREGLRVMGPTAVSAINGAKATEKDKHVKAFMVRTVNLIKQSQRSNRNQGRMARGNFGNRGRQGREIDIDRLAMDANLTWEQMDKVLPILKKARKDASDLMAEFREAGGSFRDREALADLREEMKTITEEAKPKLKALSLNDKQIKAMERQLNPMARMFDRRRGGQRGGQRGEGGRRERPERPERP